MPTTRSARTSLGKVQAATLVRFDSSRNEFVEPSPTVSTVPRLPSPTTRKTRGSSKRKVENEVTEEPSKAKRGRKSVALPPPRSPSPAKGILRPISFETNTRGLTLSPPACPAPPSPSDAMPATPLDAPQASGIVPPPSNYEAPPAMVPAELSFDFEKAKEHLISVDGRFSEIFKRLKCRPFENLAQIDPFQTLTHSILGQQISWLAARSITYKFIRLFNPSLPETRPDNADKVTGPLFPTAQQVLAMPLVTLRTAGLSQRKAEYVHDLASHFATGKLSTPKLLSSTDEELAEMLISVRGIGRWTVDMFAIFSLRRPNILPVGDLGVQRGVVRWVLSRHAPQYAWSLVPEKVDQQEKEDEADRLAKEKENRPITRSRASTPVPSSKVVDETPTTSETPSTPAQTGVGSLSLSPPRGSSPDVSSVPPAGIPTTPAPKRRSSRRSAAQETPNEESALGLPALPTPFTAGINRVLAGSMENGDHDDVLPSLPGQEGDEDGAGSKDGKQLPNLPDGLSVSVLKARLDGKKKIKGAILTPAEMDALTAEWQPYRSIGVYYMWSLADADKTK